MKKGLILILLIFVCLSGVAFAGGHGGAVHWGYSGDTGPEHWGSLSPDFKMCGCGTMQTPIDITGAVEGNLPPLQFDYQNTTLALVNNGHSIQANYASGSSINIGGDKYELLQFHFHSLSENKIDGQFFPMEAHLVHINAAGELAVVAVLFEEGAANPLLERLWGYTPCKVNSSMTVPTASINVTDLLPQSSAYYAFTGSLTTPPCSEGVRWIVLQEAATVSPAQIAKFRSFFNDHDTNRPVQPLNDRVIYK
ncbi:MAG: hypothetical protein BA864_09325 [Desulfuromonadales bacterium C00003093]|nr:MAG: hypothetical protein BA864_09325 [Desulfuromonadales bacterium C00003093]